LSRIFACQIAQSSQRLRMLCVSLV
jgi:hypothetical protein